MKQRLQLRYHKLTNKDLQKLTQLISLYEEVFEMKGFTLPNMTYVQVLLEKEHIIFYVALLDQQVVGGLTAYILPSVYFESSEIYIYDLAVKTEHQRNGIGTQLVKELKQYCKALRHKEVFVQADVTDQHAIDFYKATGGLPEEVTHFSYDLRDEAGLKAG